MEKGIRTIVDEIKLSPSENRRLLRITIAISTYG